MPEEKIDIVTPDEDTKIETEVTPDIPTEEVEKQEVDVG